MIDRHPHTLHFIVMILDVIGGSHCCCSRAGGGRTCGFPGLVIPLILHLMPTRQFAYRRETGEAGFSQSCSSVFLDSNETRLELSRQDSSLTTYKALIE